MVPGSHTNGDCSSPSNHSAIRAFGKCPSVLGNRPKSTSAERPKGRASMWLIPAEGAEPGQVANELTPLPGPAPGWFGYYGYVDWDELFDWWLGPVRTPAEE